MAEPRRIGSRLLLANFEAPGGAPQCEALLGGAPPSPSSRLHWNRDPPSAVSLMSFQLQVRLPLATIPPSGKNRSRSILIPANGWFSAHRRMRFTHSSPTGPSMAASISRGRSISAAPGLPAACRRKRCGRLLFLRRWRLAWRSMMMGIEAAAPTLNFRSRKISSRGNFTQNVINSSACF
ncbi:hypothetical protein RHE_CH02562 [Rhizobium etli CFN 42]|uniref:Uncharacterized protein n=1 Tax=Rhizobium etli (strain ATCC 51251 / DSM 11541 / JCM 21823 / NBRC 15573 / CFN 42) TaxID=347834 RepID=Q2K750_RHIEC|nr:hypothetical protein RHE_CH02562 [Rhizobium etli CFN 42]